MVLLLPDALAPAGEVGLAGGRAGGRAGPPSGPHHQKRTDPNLPCLQIEEKILVVGGKNLGDKKRGRPKSF